MSAGFLKRGQVCGTNKLFPEENALHLPAFAGRQFGLHGPG
jgi:hypothetical protein